jgi:hypothetical protein
MKKFSMTVEFLLPDDFTGGFTEALAEYVKHSKKKSKSVKLPSNLPDYWCFPYILDKGGKAYTTYSIEDFAYDNIDGALEEDLERDEAEQLESE